MLGEVNARRTVPREIEDSVVVVTGASSGIGRATARIMAESGARVVFERAVFNSEPVEQGPGNVFEPIPEQNRVSDGWGKTNATFRQVALVGGAALAGAAGVAYALLRKGR